MKSRKRQTVRIKRIATVIAIQFIIPAVGAKLGTKEGAAVGLNEGAVQKLEM